MKLFKCQSCGQLVYFENEHCERCGHRLGYLPQIGELTAVEPDGVNWVALAEPGRPYRFCANWEANACNWLLPADSEQQFCIACQHNRIIPDLSDPERHRLWQKLEEAKRRLVYSLVKLELPLPTEASGDPEPLVFNFLADPPQPGAPRVMTGHDSGVITISLAEADDAHREQLRTSMHEPYRTLLGHFRHEVGHYYWDRLVRDGGRLESFTALFGDPDQDYAAALQQHYEQGPPAGWQSNFITAYASTHPWEDWAESWAHYLHIVDTLEMAEAFGIKVNPEIADDPDLEAEIDFNPYEGMRFSRIFDAWLPLSFAVNSLNRSMGQPDLYPFVLTPAVVEKLTYIHELVHAHA